MARDRQLSFGSKYRARRFHVVREMIEAIIAAKGNCRIIDIGGEYDYWKPFLPQLDGLPITVELCNLDDRSEVFEDPRFSRRYGNACDLGFAEDLSYDLAHSNSVIEHVGRWPEMSAMAKEVRRVASNYFVQTPYFWFPIEPHFRTMGYQWLPESWRARLHMNFELGYFPKASRFDQAMIWTQHAVLLDMKQLCTLFPDGTIYKERWLLFTKSICIIRRG